MACVDCAPGQCVWSGCHDRSERQCRNQGLVWSGFRTGDGCSGGDDNAECCLPVAPSPAAAPSPFDDEVDSSVDPPPAYLQYYNATGLGTFGEACPPRRYSSFGECLPCIQSQQAQSADVRSLTIGVLCTVVVVIFVVAFLSVFRAKKKHGGTLADGFHRAREFVVYLLLSLQTACYVGPVQRVVGGHAVTPVHKLAFGVYMAFGFDTEAMAPAGCSSPASSPRTAAGDDGFQICVFVSILLMWGASACLLRYRSADVVLRSPALQHFSRRSVDLLSIVFGPVCSVVFAVMSGWQPFGAGTTVLAWCVFFFYVCCFPTSTFWMLRHAGSANTNADDGKAMGHDRFTVPGRVRRSMVLQGFVKYLTDDSWYYRHLHLLTLFCLALDRRVFAPGLSNLAQILSTGVGLVPCLAMVLLLCKQRRFLHRHRWMGWTRAAILVQVSLGYLVKVVGYFTLAEPNRVGLLVFSWLWALMYLVMFGVVGIGFGYCMFLGAKHEAAAKRRASELPPLPPRPLPTHVTELFDEHYGRPYYWNAATGEATWERPRSQSPSTNPMHHQSTSAVSANGMLGKQDYLKDIRRNAPELRLSVDVEAEVKQ